MEGNIVGTFTIAVNDVLHEENLQDDFESYIGISRRIYEARKANDVLAFEKLAEEILAFAIEQKLSPSNIQKLTPWPKRFNSVSVNRIVSEMLDE
jgi:hypothetical protein